MASVDRTGRLTRLLAKRFGAPAWALLFEVANSTGYGARRTADAVAISLWPSRGLAIHGIEIKAHRSDWLRELKTDKSAPIQKFCDYWWIAAWTDVVQFDELPPTWGLLEVCGKRGLVARRQAPGLKPAPLDKGFAAALGRRMNENVEHARTLAKRELRDAEDNDGGIRKALDRGYVRGLAEAAPTLERMKTAHQTLLDTIKTFEEASGVKLNQWRADDVGKAVRLIEEQRRMADVDIMAQQIRVLESALKAAKETRKALEPFRKRWPG